MDHFIQLQDSSPEAIRAYRKELRAIVIDRAAIHTHQIIAEYKRPTERTYERALQQGLSLAKLDVLAELFRHMHDLARYNAVTKWSRARKGLKRESHTPDDLMQRIAAYERVVRYVTNLKAHQKRG